MEPREKHGFAEAAALAGVPLAIWMRERSRWAAKDELQASGKDVPFLDYLIVAKSFTNVFTF